MNDKTMKIWKFVCDRKTPVTSQTISQHFAMHRSTAAQYLKELYDLEYLKKIRIGNVTHYSQRYNPQVAIPHRAALLPSSTPFKQQSSYPHIRGYDD